MTDLSHSEGATLNKGVTNVGVVRGDCFIVQATNWDKKTQAARLRTV